MSSLTTWLDHGRSLFNDEEFSRIRALTVAILSARRADALRSVSSIEAELAELGDEVVAQPSLPQSPEVGVPDATAKQAGRLEVVREPSPVIAPTATPHSARDAVRRIVGEHPGWQSAEILQAAKEMLPGVAEASVFSALSKLSRAGGPLRTEGPRAHYRYFPQEVTM